MTQFHVQFWYRLEAEDEDELFEVMAGWNLPYDAAVTWSPLEMVPQATQMNEVSVADLLQKKGT